VTRQAAIDWISQYLYLNAGVSNKARARLVAEEIVDRLTKVGVLTLVAA